MQITIIANNFQEEYLYNLLNNLSPKVDRIDFICSPQYDRDRLDPKIRFYKFRHNHANEVSGLQKAGRILIYYWRLIHYLLQTKSKIIHVQWLRFYVIEGILVTLLARTLNKKVVYTAHNVLPHNKTGAYYKMIFKIIYKVQSQIVVHTNHIKKQLIDEFGVDPKKVYVVHHGVYLKEKNKGITKEIARKTLNVSLNKTVLLFFGYINEYKGLDVLVKSIDLIEDDVPLEIIVAGTLLPSYKRQFEAIMAGRKHGKYHLLTSFVSEETLELCFKATDVTVLPYKEASQSGVLFMSYAFGVPVIAPSLGGFPADILVKQTGYLFQPNDPTSLANTIREFFLDWKDKDESQANFIMDYAAKNYSWNSSCQKLMQIYLS